MDDRMTARTDLLQGSLDLLILKSLILGPLPGWGLSKRINQLSEDVLSIHPGSLSPALYRLEDRGWIDAEWGVSPEGRKVKVYSLTTAGRQQYLAEQEQWRLFSGAVTRVLAAT